MVDGAPVNLVAAMDLARWRGRERFAILLDEAEALPALWAAWRDDAHRCGALDIVVVSAAPLTAGQLHAACTALGLPAEVPAHWPPATTDLHALALDGNRVRVLLAAGDARRAWRELVARIDAFLIDHPVDDPVGLPKALVRLAAHDATVTARHATPALRDGLRARGFVLAASGQPVARYRPAFVPARVPARRAEPASGTRHALIVGAGLAGAATAAALAALGWRSTVIDRHAQPAREASGNPAGLFHGIVNAHDGPHARFNRAASWAARDAVARAIAEYGVAGATDGLLRLEHAGTAPEAMRALLARLGLPARYVEALDPEAASAVAGIALQQPAWFYPQGGWVHPGGLVQAMLAQAGPQAEFRGGLPVASVARRDGQWQALGASGEVLAESAVMVIATAGDAQRLLHQPSWPLHAVRGQLTVMPRPPGLRLPAVPLAGGGYVMPEIDGRMVFGATAEANDPDPALRPADQAHNLAQLVRLLGQPWDGRAESLAGRTAWRCVAEDRLPLIGEVPDVGPGVTLTAEQARFVPRHPGLFVITALASRGITWCALGGQVLAAAIAGAPSPLPASLLEAVDPARFITRAARRAGASG